MRYDISVKNLSILQAVRAFLSRHAGPDTAYLARSGIWLNANVLVVSLLSFLLSIAFANLLPAYTYGVYQYLLSLATIIGAFTLTGMNYAVTHAVARGHEGAFKESVIAQAKWAVVPLALSCAVAAYYFLRGNALLGTSLVAIGILVPIINASNTYGAFLNGKRAFREWFFSNTLLNAGYYASIFLAVIYLKEAFVLLLVNLVVNAIVTALLLWRTFRKYRPNALHERGSLTYGRHLSLMNMFSLVAAHIDNLLVFVLLGPVPLAVYAFASTVPEKIAGLFKFLFFATLPQFSSKSRSEVRSSLRTKVLFVTLLSIPVAGAYAVAAPLLFSLLFPAYESSIVYSQAFALVIVAAAGNLSLSALIAQRQTKDLYIFNIVSPLVQIALQVTLIFIYGLWGLVIGKILGTFFTLLLSLVLTLKKSPFEALQQ